jgi:hypothetical protein
VSDGYISSAVDDVIVSWERAKGAGAAPSYSRVACGDAECCSLLRILLRSESFVLRAHGFRIQNRKKVAPLEERGFGGAGRTLECFGVGPGRARLRDNTFTCASFRKKSRRVKKICKVFGSGESRR